MKSQILTGVSLIMLAGVIAVCTSCQDYCQKSPSSCATIPAADSTAPELTLATFETPQTIVTRASGPATRKVQKGTTITLSALCIDQDGGCQNVRLWCELTVWETINGTGSQAGPGLLGNPCAENPDNKSKVGDTVSNQRNVTFRVENFANPSPNTTAIRVRAWADGINFSGAKSTTKDLILVFP